MENIDKIEVNGYHVWVDKDMEIEKGKTFLTRDNDIHKNYGYNYGNRVIIAASTELGLKEVPTYVEYLAEQYAVSKSSADVFKQAHKTDFINGFQTAEKELFTEEDVRKAIELTKSSAFVKRIHNSHVPDELLDDVDFDSTEQIIEQLKQEKNERISKT